MWILHASDSGIEPLTLRISPRATKTIGRSPGADFMIDEALVSRLHCRLEASDQTLDVVDLASTNGTYVNDKRIDRARLKSGDRLRIGRIEMTVQKAENA